MAIHLKINRQLTDIILQLVPTLVNNYEINRYAHTSATVCTVGLHAHLMLSTLHVLSVGFAVVLGTNNTSNTELVVQGIESVIGTNTTANHALIAVSKLHAS